MHKFTAKELDSETGLYYYGARYLDPKTSRWLGVDPAMGEYLPSAPINEEAKKRNGNLPGMGGVFNYVNLHVYHYAGNNPVKYVDPDGRIAQVILVIGIRVAVSAIGALLLANAVKETYKMISDTAYLYSISQSQGDTDEYQQSEGLKDRAQAAAPAPSQPPQNDDDNKKSNMQKLSEYEIEKRTGTSIHDVKNTIRNQYGKKLKEANIGRNFNIYENNGEIIIKGNQTNNELNLKINLESLGVN